MINCKVVGEGKTTLVLLHGFCENNTCFDEQVLLLKDHCKIILPDLPGFGKSNTYDGVSIASMAKDLALLLKFLKVEKCVLLGHSMGGYVTLSFAQQFPELLKGFGLLHSTATSDSQERIEKRNQVVKFINTFGKEKYIASFIPLLFSEENQKEPYVQKAVESAKSSSTEGIINAAMAMRDRIDLTQVLVQTELPIYFGIGAKDALIPQELMLSQAASCEKAYLTIFNDSAHMAMQEEPHTLAEDILKYLKTFDLI